MKQPIHNVTQRGESAAHDRFLSSNAGGPALWSGAVSDHILAIGATPSLPMCQRARSRLVDCGRVFPGGGVNMEFF